MEGLNTIATGVALGVATSATVHPALAIVLVLLLLLFGLARAAFRVWRAKTPRRYIHGRGADLLQ
jgi:hypothetical protein